jgi:hypothetical protein
MAIDPTRTTAAHNLALAAAREKAEERYSEAWDRAAELRYLLAAGAGDVRIGLEDRLALHQSIAQQARLRHVRQDGKAAGDPSAQELLAWMEDSETFAIWLREWDLWYLNSRLRFRSPMHLLGVPLDCSDEDVEAGGKALVRQFARSLTDRQWAGSQVFGHLTEELAARASARAKDPRERKRDPYFEAEQEDAERIESNAINRGFLLFKALRLAADSPSAKVKGSGLEAARHLFNMPWHSLEKACKKSLALEADKDLVGIFASHLAALAQDSNAGPVEQRLGALRDCLEGTPRAHSLRLVECRLLLDATRFREAYDSALGGLAALAGGPPGEESAALEKQFVTAVDNAALQQLPADLRRPTTERIAEFAAAARNALAEFPKAGGLRLLLARLLTQNTDDPARLAEAAAVLREGLDLFLNADQVRDATQLLERTGAKSEAAEALARVRTLLEEAAASARGAVEAWRPDRTATRTRHAVEQLEHARDHAAQAEEIASQAKLEAAAARARSLIQDLDRLREEIGRG